jgi:hypothetical protein
MSTWRTETAKNNEKNIEQVIGKMAGALLRRWDGQGKCNHFPNRGDEPLPALDAIYGAVAESLGRRDGVLAKASSSDTVGMRCR